MVGSAGDLKSVFEYESFRQYLVDYFNLKKAQDPKFSHRSFAKMAGFRSPSFLMLVMNSKANLSKAGVEKVAAALNFNRDEEFYFKNLVHLNQAQTVEDRQLYAQQILKSKKYKKLHPLSEHIYEYLTHWHYAAIKELVSMKGFQEDPDWISERLRGKVTSAEVKKTIEVLLKLGLIMRTKSGHLQAAMDIIVTPDQVTSPFMAQYHEEFIRLASESIKEVPREFREISGTTFCLSKKSLLRIKEMIQRFRIEMVEVLAQEKDPEGIYQLNLQFFPLAYFDEDLKKFEK